VSGHLQIGNNQKNAKIGWDRLKIFSRTTGPENSDLHENFLT
jgi:hypothetical protein